MSRENQELAVIFEENPEYGVLDFTKLRHKISRDIASDKVLKEFLAKRNNIFAKKYRPKVFFRIASMSYTWQVDLMVYKDRIFFAGIEVNSRFGYLEPLKRGATGAAREWLPCLRRIIDLKRPSRKIICDAQFANSHECRRLCEQKHVKLYSFVSRDMHKYHGNKLGFIDRFIRTMKWYDTKLNRPDMTVETRMNKLVDLYNNSPHSYLAQYIKADDVSRCDRGNRPPPLSPADVVDDDELLNEIYTDNMAYNHDLRAKLFAAFKVGDRVRHVLPRDAHAFRQKEGIMLSREIYRITGVKNTGYVLTSERTDETLEKLYKPNELKAALEDPLPPVARRQRNSASTRRRATTRMEREARDLREGADQVKERRATRQEKVKKQSEANRAQARIRVGTRLKVRWLAPGRQLKWFWGTVKKVHPTVGRDVDGQVLYVDIKWDDGERSDNFRLFEDYYGREDVESGWKI